jgi:hypothetical protein
MVIAATPSGVVPTMLIVWPASQKKQRTMQTPSTPNPTSGGIRTNGAYGSCGKSAVRLNELLPLYRANPADLPLFS